MNPDVARNAEVYRTRRGLQLAGDSAALLAGLPEASVDLVVTSPALRAAAKEGLRQRGRGTVRRVVRPLRGGGPPRAEVQRQPGARPRGRLPAGPARAVAVQLPRARRVLRPAGLRTGARILLYNPAKLPSPIEGVNKRKIRAKDAVNTVWWLSRSTAPKADTRLVEIETGRERSAEGEGGDGGDDPTPSNLLRIPNTESNSAYLRHCRLLGRQSHPARFPAALPRFFIRLLDRARRPGGRHLLGVEHDRRGRRATRPAVAEHRARPRLHAGQSAVRFLDGCDDGDVRRTMARIDSGEVVEIDDRKLPL